MKSSIRPPNSWPAWTNPPIALYHGTLLSYAKEIVGHGVDVSRAREATDFGRGFYTTTMLDAAEEWSRRKSAANNGMAPAIVKVCINRMKLADLSANAFVRGSLDAVDFWRFVYHCRQALPHLPAGGGYYDVCMGPVAKSWWGPSNSRLLKGYDQISFHTNTAQRVLNDPDSCALEVL